MAATRNVTEASVQPGPGTDAKGQAVRDPSDNVMDLVEAAIDRQDDLRDVNLTYLRDLLDYGERLRAAEAKFYDERDRRYIAVLDRRHRADDCCSKPSGNQGCDQQRLLGRAVLT